MGACAGKEPKPMPKTKKLSLKILIIGQANVGKTSVLKRYCDGEFPAAEDPTLQNDGKSKSVELEPGVTETLQLWDTAGTEKYRQLTQTFYVNCKGVVVMYDVTDQASYDALPNWLQEVQTYCKTNPQVILVGNKTDLQDKRVVSFEKANAFATERGLAYIETSAASGDHVDNLFVAMAKAIKSAEDDILGS